MRRHLLATVALTGFVLLALGSGEATDEAASKGATPEPVPVQAEPVDDGEAAPSGGFPTDDDGRCCCALMESDQEVYRFRAEGDCVSVAGACVRDLEACAETARADAAAEALCCCEQDGRGTLVADGACDGTCHDFYVEADSPGSCTW